MSNSKRQARQQRAINRLNRQIQIIEKHEDENAQYRLEHMKTTLSNTSRNLSKKI